MEKKKKGGASSLAKDHDACAVGGAGGDLVQPKPVSGFV